MVRFCSSSTFISADERSYRHLGHKCLYSIKRHTKALSGSLETIWDTRTHIGDVVRIQSSILSVQLQLEALQTGKDIAGHARRYLLIAICDNKATKTRVYLRLSSPRHKLLSGRFYQQLSLVKCICTSLNSKEIDGSSEISLALEAKVFTGTISLRSLVFAHGRR